MTSVISKRDFASVLLADYVERADVVLAAFEARASLKAGREPQWNLVFPRGTWHGPNFEKLGGSFTVDDAFISEVIENWVAAGKPRLPVRWTHEHLKNTDPAKVPLLDRKAANIIDLRATEAGLEALTDWKPAGAKDIEDGAFDAWSAEWAPRHINRLTGKVGGWFLSGVALTSEPYFNLMPPVAASHEMGGGMSEAIKWLKAAIARHERHMSGAEPTSDASQMQMMDEMKRALAALDELPMVAANQGTTKSTPQHRSNTMNEEQLKALRAKLGLAADATIEQILAAAHPATTVTASAPDAATITAAVKSAVEPLQAQLTAAQVETKALKASLLERDVDALIATAKRGDGKLGRAINDTLVATAKKIAAGESLDAAKAFLEAIPASVPLQAQGVTGTPDVVLTQEAAQKKLQLRADELRAKGDKEPYLAALKEMPDVALIAEGRSTSTTIKAS